MTHFLDGPAKGQTLMLKRACRFLRVVEAGGKWDALDQPEDTPSPAEKIYAYEIAGQPSMAHIRASGGRGGFFALADYKLVPEQPDDSQMRDARAWHFWCQAKGQPAPPDSFVTTEDRCSNCKAKLTNASTAWREAQTTAHELSEKCDILSAELAEARAEVVALRKALYARDPEN